MTSTSRLTRRQALTVGGGAMATILLAACQGGATATGGVTSTSATALTGQATSAAAAPTSTSAAAATSSAATSAATVGSVATRATSVAAIPRAETLIISVSDTVNSMTDFQVANPLIIGTLRTGWQFAFEPLYFYNEWWADAVTGPPGLAGKNGEIPYLATGYAYNSSYDQLTLTLRQGVEWSDGQPFTAKDVVFTINMLKDNAPKLNFSYDMKLWVKEVTAPDDHTVAITLTSPNSRFMSEYLQWYEDHGFPIVPQHIYQGQDPTSFSNFDLAKGWPVTTGPWRLVYSSPEQKFWDRRDDWWGAKTGFHPLPTMRRIIVLPLFAEAKLAQLLISNQADATHQLQPQDARTVAQQNPKVILRVPLQDHPWGWIASFPEYIGFNTSLPPFDDPQIRWAVNHAINRMQIVQIGFQGDDAIAVLPFETNRALQPYYDAVADLLKQNPIDDFDPAKTAQLMQAKGYQKDQADFWAKEGKRLSIILQVPQGFFDNYLPIVVEQLRKAGFDTNFKSPPNESTQLALGQVAIFLAGQQGAVRDPYATLEQFHSRYVVPNGQTAQYPFRWANKDFDQAVDAMGKLPVSDPKFMAAYIQAMQQWIPNLPTIPLVQDFVIIPVNTTYWTGWPDGKDPYTMPAFWLRGSAGLLINTLKPAK